MNPYEQLDQEAGVITAPTPQGVVDPYKSLDIEAGIVSTKKPWYDLSANAPKFEQSEFGKTLSGGVFSRENVPDSKLTPEYQKKVQFMYNAMKTDPEVTKEGFALTGFGNPMNLTSYVSRKFGTGEVSAFLDARNQYVSELSWKDPEKWKNLAVDFEKTILELKGMPAKTGAGTFGLHSLLQAPTAEQTQMDWLDYLKSKGWQGTKSAAMGKLFDLAGKIPNPVLRRGAGAVVGGAFPAAEGGNLGDVLMGAGQGAVFTPYSGKRGGGIIAYHGTNAPEFEKFVANKDYGKGVIGWFSENPEQAKAYSERINEIQYDKKGNVIEPGDEIPKGARTIKAELDIKNPLDLTDLKDGTNLTSEQFEKLTGIKPDIETTRPREFRDFLNPNIVKQLVDKGYDGIKIREEGDITWAVIKSPDQIKVQPAPSSSQATQGTGKQADVVPAPGQEPTPKIPDIYNKGLSQIKDYKKEGIFISKEETPSLVWVPVENFTQEGPNLIRPSQGQVRSNYTKKRLQKIIQEEGLKKPFIVVSDRGEKGAGMFGPTPGLRITDGHVRLVAYIDAGYKHIPVIDKTGGKLVGSIPITGQPTLEQPKRRLVSKSKALKLGHQLPDVLGWTEAQRRDFMNGLVGRKSVV